jgi:hypothetical protein
MNYLQKKFFFCLLGLGAFFYNPSPGLAESFAVPGVSTVTNIDVFSLMGTGLAGLLACSLKFQRTPGQGFMQKGTVEVFNSGILNPDQERQFKCPEFTGLLEEFGIHHCVDGRGQGDMDNIFVN